MIREETEILEGEVVEVQVDRPTTTAVSSVSFTSCLPQAVYLLTGCKGGQGDLEDYRDGDCI